MVNHVLQGWNVMKTPIGTNKAILEWMYISKALRRMAHVALANLTSFSRRARVFKQGD